MRSKLWYWEGFRATALLLAVLPVAYGQTTQAILAGRVLDGGNGRSLPKAQVAVHASSSALTVAVQTDESGHYAIPQLSPELYRVRVTAEGYQPQEVHSVRLPVAGRIDLDFQLRRLSDVWESGEYRSVQLRGSRTLVTFYGPDVDTSRSAAIETARGVQGALESTVSDVVDGRRVASLPLQGRDVYTMLVTQPAVTTDTTTSRSLGLSSNGQRPSASNFLLDGLENNNSLVSGPLTPVAPEATAEYRVSTNNFSAEYGRAAGYIANAITRAGSNEWHGVGYFNFRNEALNANDFQLNARTVRRSPLKEAQLGTWVGGPLQRDRLLASFAFEHARNRGRGYPLSIPLPTQALVQSTRPDSIARRLLTTYAAPYPVAPGASANATVFPTVSADRDSALARADRIFGSGKHRLMGRLTVLRLDRPDFFWNPYPGLSSALTQNTTSTAFSLSSSLTPGLNNEFRGGYSYYRLNIERPDTGIPDLPSADGTVLPTSILFSTLDHRSGNWEFVDNLSWVRGRHFIAAGGGILLRGLSGYLTAAPDGQFAFQSVVDFANDRPAFFRTGIDRSALPTLRLPDYYREYSSRQFYLFFQDTWRVTPRLALNFGVRYESLGSPVNTGQTKDAVVEVGAGETMAQRLATARITYPQGGDQQVYAADRNDWAGRLGFSYRVIGPDKLLLRGAFGIFYDRLFDNLWLNVRNNRFVVPGAFPLTGSGLSYLTPVAEALPQFQGQPLQLLFPTASIIDQTGRAPLTWMQPGIRTPYIHSFFLGLSSQLFGGWSVEVNALGSSGRKLITTDLLNRGLNPNLGLISYRANQGSSIYTAMMAVARYRSRRGQLQAAYTLGHTIDNQSEVLRSDYFNLSPVRLTTAETRIDVSAFSRQFDSSADRGNSDFDQRHNLVFFSIWDLPQTDRSRWLKAVTGGWAVSQVAAFRSGLPYTVYAYGSPLDPVINNRANLIDNRLVESVEGLPVPTAGVRLMSPAGFSRAPAGTLGNTGRNAFRGPGFYNLDASLSRSFMLPWREEGMRLILRADVFNILNHANLNLPESQLGHPLFGIATYGRTPPGALRQPVVPAPGDSARQVQLLLRVTF